MAYSIGTPGCNFHCRWCQNWQISQVSPEKDLTAGTPLSPEDVVAAAREAGSRMVAYTYTEPTIFFEYAYDTAGLARKAGMANVFVTNGYMSQHALETIHPVLDAANVDLKAFRDTTYRRYVGARLQPILKTMKRLKQRGVWLEVTTLVIPGINDDPRELRDAARFVARELGVETPWHISRFFPAYKMTDVPPTPMSSLNRAHAIGREEGLRYVYVGNVREEADTFCHACGELLVARAGMHMAQNRVARGSRCPRCGAPVAGVGMSSSET
jgi:pyruvate formate lyase activating enzyme